MKKQITLFCAILAILVFAAGCAPDYKAEYQKTIDTYYGTVSSGHYSNQWLKLEMDVPEQWNVMEDPMKAVVVSAGDAIKDQKALEEAVANVEGISVYNLLQVSKNPIENQKDFNPSLVVMAERVEGKGVADAAAYLEASRAVMAQRQMPMGFTQKLEATVDTVTIGGMEFAHLPVVVETGLFRISQDQYALMQGDTVLGIMITWKDEPEKEAIMKALNTLKIAK